MGKGFGSVLVYLTDERGNRIGQSCRSVSDTGEFKVLVNEPGKYLLVGYKRGYIVEDPEAARLPIESGKIEGFTLRMIAEGCLVHGRVLFEEYGQLEPGLGVRCVRLEDGFTRSATVESAGTFRITGVPHDSTCQLEVLSGEGEVLATSDAFQTERERELFRNITIPSTQIVEAFGETTTEPADPPGRTTGRRTGFRPHCRAAACRSSMNRIRPSYPPTLIRSYTTSRREE